MSSWFGKEKAPEKSEGGSLIRRYGNQAPDVPRGVTESSTEFARAREEVYARLFGEAASVSHEIVPLVPHIDVYSYNPGHRGRDFCTLITGGMSDLEMNVPAEAKRAPRRVELVFYCSEQRQEYIDTLRQLAHFPHAYKTWIGSGHTMPNGDPPEPLWGSAVLDTILFMPTIVRPDDALADQLSLAGQPVHFLWVVPLTTPETNLKLAKGFNAILDLFGQHRHPHVFNADRPSYI
jgi:hypothetical protein